MEYRPLDLTIVSAKGLKDVNLLSRMDVYAVATLSSDPRSRQRTPVDKYGGKNPTWNFPMKFMVPCSGDPSAHVIRIDLKSERAFGDRDVGQVHVPVKELLAEEDSSSSNPQRLVSYQVRKPSGKPKGSLNLSYKFGDKFTPPAHKSNEQPVMAYPAAMAGPSGGPPPPPNYAYPAPPPPQGGGYGYPPPQVAAYPPQAGYGYGYGYGHAPPPPPPGMVVQPQRPPKKNKFGMGLGAGLLGGALGGLLIGDMISDSSDMYDAGYDAGFDDAGGFGF